LAGPLPIVVSGAVVSNTKVRVTLPMLPAASAERIVIVCSPSSKSTRSSQ
jgi:hypothetical protein